MRHSLRWAGLAAVSLAASMVAVGCSCDPEPPEVDAGIELDGSVDADIDAARRPDAGRDASVDAPAAPPCGNGRLDEGEACDDGNIVAHDGCSSSCAVERGWTCDGEPSVCEATCGDGLLAEGAEVCDDHNTDDHDGCSSLCVVEPGWSCTRESPSVCASDCGNGIVGPTEECDDENNVDDDGCSASCRIERTFTCTGAPSVCVTHCGNGAIEPDEACDDGAREPLDGCSAFCEIEAGWTCPTGAPTRGCTTDCGDGVRAEGVEECDDGNVVDGDGCDTGFGPDDGAGAAWLPACLNTRCGNGIVTDGEACDDGNNADGDGCSATCTIE